MHRPRRHGRLLRERRAAAAAGAARAAGGRGRQRAAGRRHDRQLRGAPVRRSSPPRRPSARGGCAPRRSSSRPTSSHYRARSREVHGGAARPRRARRGRSGLDEAYLDLTGLDRRRSAARRVKEAVTGRDRAHLLGRDRAEQARGEGGLGRREAGRLRRADAPRRRASASPDASPGLVPGIGPKTVARLERLGHRPPSAALGATPDAQPDRVVRPPPRPAPGRARPLRGRARHRDRAGGQVRVARDHLRPRPARPRPSSSRCCERLTEQLCETLARAGAPRPHDRHQGPLRRLHDGHPRAHARRRGERPRRPSAASRSSCCAGSTRAGRCGCSACGWPASTSASRPGPRCRPISSRLSL